LLSYPVAPPSSLGAVNDLTRIVSSGMRCLGTIFASSNFSISLETRPVQERLVEVIMLGITLIRMFCSLRLP
ncbi:hypothetical protein GGU11DRAFT_644433, partial [Lentinula aff. detonsa]